MRRLLPRIFALALLAIALFTGFFYPVTRISQTQSVGVFTGYRGWTKSAPYPGGFLVAWEDGRFGSLLVKGYAARINSAGTTLDPAGIALGTVPFHQWDPAVSCIGNQCLIAWQQANLGLMVRSVDASTGATGPVRLLGTAAYAAAPDIANDGTRFLVIYGGDSSGVVGRFVAADGTLLGAGVTVFINVPGALPSVAFGNGNYLVTAVDVNTKAVSTRAFAGNGTALSANLSMGTAFDQFWPAAVCATPTGFLVTWSDASRHLVVRRLSATGIAVDGAPVQPLTAGGIRRDQPSAAFDGTGMVLVWRSDDYSLRALRLDPNLALTTAELTLIPQQGKIQDGPRLSLVQGGRTMLTWWEEDFIVPITFQSRFLSSSDAGVGLLPEGLIQQQLPDLHDWPAAAPLGDGFVIGWSSAVDGKVSSVLQPVNALGVPSGPSVKLGGPGNQMFGPGLLTQSGLTRAAWLEGTSMLSARIDAQGQPLPSTTLGTGFGWASTPSLAALNGRTLVAWTGTDSIAAAFARIVEADGGLAGPSYLRLPLTGNLLYRPVVAASNTQFALAYLNVREPTFTRITPFGGVLDGMGVALDSNSAAKVALASDGTDFLAAWSTSSGPISARRIRGSDGTAIDAVPFEISSGYVLGGSVGNPAEPTVIFDGTNYVVAWSEPVDDGGSLDIYRRQVFRDGGLGIVEWVVGGPAEEQKVALAQGTQGQMLYAWLEPDPVVGALRVDARVGSSFFVDAGGIAADAGMDAGAADGGDGGTMDGGVPDGGFTDGGVMDGGVMDGGDADGGVTDGGDDAGSTNDGGPLDAGPSSDGGMIDGGERDGGALSGDYQVGCGCSGGGSEALVGAALLLLLKKRRRRAKRGQAAF